MYRRILLLVVSILFAVPQLHAQKYTKDKPCAPIIHDEEVNGMYDYSFTPSNEQISKVYKPIFDKYQINYNAATWEKVLENILKQVAPDIDLKQGVIISEFGSDDDEKVTFAVFHDKEIKLFNALGPVLENKKKLEEMLKKMDKKDVNY